MCLGLENSPSLASGWLFCKLFWLVLVGFLGLFLDTKSSMRKDGNSVSAVGEVGVTGQLGPFFPREVSKSAKTLLEATWARTSPKMPPA